MDEADRELSALSQPDGSIFETLSPPGSGATPERFRSLWRLAAQAPALGRVAEAHHDAMAILAEAGRDDIEPGLHAVWAAGRPDALQLRRVGEQWHLRGSKHWCSAARFASRALVTAQSEGGEGMLVLVDPTHAGVVVAPPNWQSPAMAAVETRIVHFDLDVSEHQIIGVNGWYLNRAGFWHGAVGVAACWAGCADGIVNRVMHQWRDDPHALAHLGAIDALLWSLRAAIDAAGAEIDCEPVGSPETRQRRALRVRHIADTIVGEIVSRIARAVGPAPLAHTPNLHRHIAETELYRRQSHAERDLEVLGSLVC